MFYICPGNRKYKLSGSKKNEYTYIKNEYTYIRFRRRTGRNPQAARKF